MTARGIQEFYYTQNLPDHAVSIAKVYSEPLTPDQLTDIDNTYALSGKLGVWLNTSALTSDPDFPKVGGVFVEPAVGQSFPITGYTSYKVTSPYLEITNVVSAAGNPLYYRHSLPNASDIRILDLEGNVVSTEFKLSGGVLYHSLDGAAYRIRYLTVNGLQTTLLRYDHVQAPQTYAAGPQGYLLGGVTLEVYAGGATYWVRFTRRGEYGVQPLYETLSNTPWYPRISAPTNKANPEWGQQMFQPFRPYQLGTWVPGRVLDNTLIEFSRQEMLVDPQHLPDMLIYDRDNVLKYALDGSVPGSPRRRGSFYPWKRGMIKYEGSNPVIDATHARVEVVSDLQLASDDIVFGFYAYRELDLIYRHLDLNPFTNPQVRNTIVNFYYRTRVNNPYRVVWHEVTDPATGAVLYSDPVTPNGGDGSKLAIASIVVGASANAAHFTLTDVRQRGGGLAPTSQNLPQAVNFLDIGYIDGKPYPVGGCLIVHLPGSILNKMKRADVQNLIQSVLPMGVMAAIFYYDGAGEEYR